MWVARFKLKDEDDIYAPLCKSLNVEFFAIPHTHFVKYNKINFLVSGVLSGSEKSKLKFVHELKKNIRVRRVEKYKDFIFVHTQDLLSKELKSEISIFYNPQNLLVKPVKVTVDGWEYWELASLNRTELNKVVKVALKKYSGVLFSIKEETLRAVSSLEFSPNLTEKQFDAIKLAYKKGYYKYPRERSLIDLSKLAKKSYSSFQETLRRAENKLIDFFFKYR